MANVPMIRQVPVKGVGVVRTALEFASRLHQSRTKSVDPIALLPSLPQQPTLAMIRNPTLNYLFTLLRTLPSFIVLLHMI